MARSQNGVNGSIPQQPYGIYATGFPMNNQITRNQNPTMFSYQDNMPQVLQPPFVSQAYSAQMSPGTISNISVPPPYLFYSSGNYTMAAPYTQYQYPQMYPPQFQYATDPPTAIPTQPPPQQQPSITNSLQQNSSRKFSPLVVTDPTSKTDLDLTKFQNQNKKETSSSTSSQSLLIDEVELKKEPDKEPNNNNNKKPVPPTPQSQQSIEIEKKQLELSETTIKKDEVVGNNVAETSSTELVHLPVVKSDIVDDDGTMVSSISEDEQMSSEPYYLTIDKKDSDEMILRKKLTYDREYLLKLKDNGLRKPKNMPFSEDFSEDIILKEPLNLPFKKPDSPPVSTTEKYSKNKPIQRQYSSPYPRKFKGQERKLITLDAGQPSILIRTKSGYLPPNLRTKDKSQDHMDELRRNIKGNLNKITPQNFQECLSDILKLNIKENEELSCLINEIFVKAVKEEAYSVTYAQFCNKLASDCFETQAFKSQLLKKCQDMFQTPLQEQLQNVRKEWEQRIESESDEKMKILYVSDLEEQAKKAKDKYFGNIRFIGELFLHHLLAGKVILSCISELLKDSDDPDGMLALCKLLETCGKQIDMRHKEQMNNFIRSMQTLSQSDQLETRIRFKLRDIIDMRDRDWTLRHIQQEKKIRPKTKEEQKQEAEIELANKIAVMQIAAAKKNMPAAPTRRNPQYTQTTKMSFKNLTCNSHTVDEKTVLGPVRNWTAGSGSKPPKPREDTWINVQNKPRSTAVRNACNSRSREQSPQVNKYQNKYLNLESSAEASGADSRSSTPPITHPQNVLFPNIDIESHMTDDERADMIFNDLLLKGQFDEDCWSRIANKKPVIEKWIDDMMEKDASCRRYLGDSFARMLRNDLIHIDQLIDGSQIFVSSIPDLICDIPKLWEFLSQFFERFICDKNSNIDFISKIFKDILPNKDVAKCLSDTLHAASSRLGHNIVGQVFHRSCIDWKTIVPNNLEEFVNKNELQFTIAGGVPLSPSGGCPLDAVEEELNLMLARNESNEDIFAYLETHVDRPTWKSVECTRTLTECIFKAMKCVPDVNLRDYLKTKMEIVKRVSQHKTQNELEILRSTHNLVSELSPDRLTMIYDIMMTEDVITSDSCQKYLECHLYKTDPNFELTYNFIHQLICNFVDDR